MEKINLWSETIKIRTFMIDKHLEANLVTIQNLCQEAAGSHANACQLGYTDMYARGMIWVLNRLKINVLQYPKWLDVVTIRSWVSVIVPFSHRHFEVVLPVSDTNPTEIVLANAYTIWIPIDATTKRPKRLSQEDFPLLERVYDCEMAEKLQYTEGVVFSSERTVQYADLDMLGHVNNAKYVEWLLDDFYRTNPKGKPKLLDINYLGELFAGVTVQIFVLHTADIFIYAIRDKVSGKEVCRAKIVVGK